MASDARYRSPIRAARSVARKSQKMRLLQLTVPADQVDVVIGDGAGRSVALNHSRMSCRAARTSSMTLSGARSMRLPRLALMSNVRG